MGEESGGAVEEVALSDGFWRIYEWRIRGGDFMHREEEQHARRLGQGVGVYGRRIAYET